MVRMRHRRIHRLSDGRWGNAGENTTKPATIHESVDEAIARATVMLIRAGGGELVVEAGPDGEPTERHFQVRSDGARVELTG